MTNILTEGVGFVRLLQVGDGDQLRSIKAGTVTIDPPSIATVSRGAATGTIPGLAVGDRIVMSPPDLLNDDLLFVGAAVTGPDTVTVYLYNPTIAAINEPARAWEYLAVDVVQ